MDRRAMTLHAVLVNGLLVLGCAALVLDLLALWSEHARLKRWSRYLGIGSLFLVLFTIWAGFRTANLLPALEEAEQVIIRNHRWSGISTGGGLGLYWLLRLSMGRKNPPGRPIKFLLSAIALVALYGFVHTANLGFQAGRIYKAHVDKTAPSGPQREKPSFLLPD